MAVIAVYGGGFSPPHVGHGMVLSWILATGRADVVVLAPAAAHPFGKQMAPFPLRHAWCHALIADLGIRRGLARVTDAENDLLPPNYTINLLRHLRARWKGDKVRCVMGADNLALRAKWHGFDDIEREFDPIYVNRAGVVLPPGVEVDSPVFPDISSTEVRRRLAAGEPVGHLLSRKVEAMVRQSGVFA